MRIPVAVTRHIVCVEIAVDKVRGRDRAKRWRRNNVRRGMARCRDVGAEFLKLVTARRNTYRRELVGRQDVDGRDVLRGKPEATVAMYQLCVKCRAACCAQPKCVVWHLGEIKLLPQNATETHQNHKRVLVVHDGMCRLLNRKGRWLEKSSRNKNIQSQWYRCIAL